MVLRVLVNKSTTDRMLPWGQWNISLPAGGEIVNPSSGIVRAFLDRYSGLEVVLRDDSKVVAKIEEVPEVPEVMPEEVPEEVKIEKPVSSDGQKKRRRKLL
jgi:hypothetical protein